MARVRKVLMIPAVIALIAAACGGSDSGGAQADEAASDASGADSPPTECPTEGEEWETAKLYIEHNATDEDTGVHGLFGGEAWSELCTAPSVPAEFLLPDTIYELEVLVLEESGNQTITVGFFRTA